MSKPSYHGPDNIRSYDGKTPLLGERVMIDPSAVVLGDLVMGDDVSVWPQCAIRADMHRIRIGHGPIFRTIRFYISRMQANSVKRVGR